MEHFRLNVQSHRAGHLTDGRHFLRLGRVVRVLDGRSAVEQPR